MGTALVVTLPLLLLAACHNDRDGSTQAPLAPSAVSVASSAADKASDKHSAGSPANAPVPSAIYERPPADVLYQIVAPVALYPDKLLAQVLAASTYPDQVMAAQQWFAQNPELIKNDLRNQAANEQAWDPSIKALTQFPSVLEQMSSNLVWSTALGTAYHNFPTDVLNAILGLRLRALKAGSLVSSARLTVTQSAQPTPSANYVPSPAMAVNDYPEPEIPPPASYIEIAPSLPDTIHVPRYDPAQAFGDPLPLFPGYHPLPAPKTTVTKGETVHAADTDATTPVHFGSAIVLAPGMEQRPWGWQAWSIHWGYRGTSMLGWHPGEPPPPPAARPAVVFNNTTYLTRSTTLPERAHRTDTAALAGASAVAGSAPVNIALDNAPHEEAGPHSTSAVIAPAVESALRR